MTHIPPGCFLVKLRWGLVGDPEEMISTLAVRDADDEARDVIQVARSVAEAWEGAFVSSVMLCTGYTFLGADAIAGGTGGTSDVGSWQMNNPGGRNASPPPSNCCALVKKKSALGGRANAGRMFLPAGYLGENTVGPTGLIDGPQVTELQEHLTQFLVNLLDSTPGIGQELANFIPLILHSDPGKLPTQIMAFFIDRLIASQRQRMRH